MNIFAKRNSPQQTKNILACKPLSLQSACHRGKILKFDSLHFAQIPVFHIHVLLSLRLPEVDIRGQHRPLITLSWSWFRNKTRDNKSCTFPETCVFNNILAIFNCLQFYKEYIFIINSSNKKIYKYGHSRQIKTEI